MRLAKLVWLEKVSAHMVQWRSQSWQIGVKNMSRKPFCRCPSVRTAFSGVANRKISMKRCGWNRDCWFLQNWAPVYRGAHFLRLQASHKLTKFCKNVHQESWKINFRCQWTSGAREPKWPPQNGEGGLGIVWNRPESSEDRPESSGDRVESSGIFGMIPSIHHIHRICK